MKKILFILLAVLMAAPVSVSAKKEKTEKKEKAEFVWELPNPLSGNETVDRYLLRCDTLWTKIQEYSDNLARYDYTTDTIEVDGKFYCVAKMLNPDGQVVTKGEVNWQLVNAIASCTGIVLDCTNIGLTTASATMTLPKLGLNAIKWGKYVKVGPKIIEKGTKEIGEISKIRKAQLRQWRSMKQNALSIEQVKERGIGKALNLTTDKDLKKVEKCMFITEIPDTSEEFTTIKTHYESLSDAEKEKYNPDYSTIEMAPEDKAIELENDDDIDKFLD